MTLEARGTIEDSAVVLTTGVVVKRMPGFRIAYVEHRGPYDEIGFAFQRLLRSLRERHLHGAGPMIAIRPQEPDPEEDSRRNAEAAVSVSQEFKGESELRCRELPPADVASLIYEGPPGRYPAAIELVRDWLVDHELVAVGPMREVYSRDLSELPPGILYLEIQQPFRRKGGG